MRILDMKGNYHPTHQRTDQGDSVVLLIEDDLVDAEAVSRMMKNRVSEGRSSKLAFVHVADLKTGLEQLGNSNVVAVILDLSLPDSSGLETFELLKKTSKQVPVVILTGDGDRRHAREAIRKGAQDFILKSEVNDRWLSHALDHAIERKHLEHKVELLIDRLRQALDELSANNGVRISVCAWCGRVRNQSGEFVDFEEFLKDSREFVSHGVCNGCEGELMKGLSNLE